MDALQNWESPISTSIVFASGQKTTSDSKWTSPRKWTQNNQPKSSRTDLQDTETHSSKRSKGGLAVGAINMLPQNFSGLPTVASNSYNLKNKNRII